MEWIQFKMDSQHDISKKDTVWSKKFEAFVIQILFLKISDYIVSSFDEAFGIMTK